MPDALAKYAEAYAELTSLLDHGVALVEAQRGHKIAYDREFYAERIFTKMICHGLSLKRLSPSPALPPGELWDISSNYAIARALIETYEALSYVSLEAVEENERAFRMLLWKLHAQERRREMLRLIGSGHPEITAVDADISAFRRDILRHPLTQSLGSSFRGKVERGETPPYHLSRAERDARSNINKDYHAAVIMHLSAHVHTHPFSVHQLLGFQAGDPDCIRLMAIPIQYCLTFLGKAVIGMRELFSPRVPPMADDIRKIVDIWGEVLTKGLKDAR
jgi:hypothetical protein